jgi:hypothetical protein
MVERERFRRGLATLKLIAAAACVAFFLHALATSDLAGAWTRIRELGPLAVIVLLPFPLAVAFDAAAWHRLLRGLGRRVPLRELYLVRVAVEAVHNSTPAGVVWAEAAAPFLVAKRTTASATDAFAAATAKRWLVVRVHAAYVATALALGWSAVEHASPTLLRGGRALPYLLLACAAGLLLLSGGIEAIAARAQIAGRLSSTLVAFPRLRAWIAERRHHFEHADAQLARLSKDGRSSAAAAVRLALAWLLDGCETFLVLHLLGAHIGFVEVLSFDAALSALRSAAVFAPAGIGVQDAGYLAVLHAYGVPDAASIGPALVVLKRAKEVFWIAAGYAVLAALRPATRYFAQSEPAATRT